MREIRPYGSEAGEPHAPPTPIIWDIKGEAPGWSVSFKRAGGPNCSCRREESQFDTILRNSNSSRETVRV